MVDSAESCVQGFAGIKEIETDDYQGWIDSWYKGTEAPPHADNFIPTCYVYTEGYYSKGRKGGYGVIITDDEHKPIVASAVACTEVVSSLYHQLQGVVRGVELAMEYSFGDIDLFCHTEQVSDVVQRILQKDQRGRCCFHSDEVNSFDVICKNCAMDYTGEDYPVVFHLLKRIGEMDAKLYLPINVINYIRERNKAADYLAKNGAPGMEKLSPCDFPDELKEILCKDYFES